MLVLSRRETQKVLFPSLGISIEVARVQGKTVRLGIDAPDQVRIIRSELADKEPVKLESKSNGNAHGNGQGNGHANNGVPFGASAAGGVARKNLEATKLAIRLAQNQLQQRLNGHAEEALMHALDCLEKLDRVISIATDSQPDELTVHEDRAGYHVDSRPAAVSVESNNLDLELQLDDCRPPKRYCVVA